MHDDSVDSSSVSSSDLNFNNYIFYSQIYGLLFFLFAAVAAVVTILTAQFVDARSNYIRHLTKVLSTIIIVAKTQHECGV